MELTLTAIETAVEHRFEFVTKRLRILFTNNEQMNSVIFWEDLGLSDEPADWGEEDWQALGDFLDELITARNQRIKSDDYDY